MISAIKKSQPIKRQAAWQNPNFLILLISGTIVTFGSKIYELALPLILYSTTSSPVVMSTMRGIEFLPNLFLAMFIGVLVDRARKKRWSLWMITLQIVILLVLFLSIHYGNAPILLFYICGFFLMTFNYAFLNARASMVKLALPNEMLTSANASFNLVHNFIGIMGPALTGLILMLSSLHMGLLITAISFMFSFMILLLVKADENVGIAKKEGFWKELKEGWVELYRNQTLWLVTIAVVFLNSTAGMVDTTVIFYAKDVLKLSNAELGVLLSTAGIGGLLGSLIIGKVRAKWTTGVVTTVTTLLLGFTYLMMYFASNPYVLGVSLLLNGVFSTICSLCIWTFRQESTPHHLIGRISGITGSAFKLGMPFAIFAAGWISELANPEWVFLLSFIGNILIFIFCRMSLLWKK
ncbi:MULTISPECIES: MFS transporter [unclassified Bacillus (in: firmicutes)]|uniref:MFS transporter n=1 Tax=unclassified Bacillus (in: firmicutes) TaxID=185979 RepID=UPI0008E2ED4F|nr:MULTISPECIES: MFS transporter [unclassified Bacillus (in: firmicutes)]SFA69489.1 Na+/melibiose symporter [Bacillus sp. UNCCL13]SFQ58794.1 Na+/melibiose symporter [Bacillus sp. cl95]